MSNRENIPRRVVMTLLTWLVAACFLTTPCLAYTNPVFNFDRPDPGILYHDGQLYMMHTMGGPPGWPLLQASNLTSGWAFQGHMVTTSNQASWMKGPYWAPEVHRVQSQKSTIPLFQTEDFKFCIPFTCQRTSDNKFCVGIASAPNVNGPYTCPSGPLVVDAIDANIFQDYDGRKYFLYHRWASQRIYIRELNADCTAFKSGSSESVIVTLTPSSWEGNTVEGPWMYRRGDYYYVFYSGNDCCGANSTEYAVGVARSNTSPTSGFTKNPANPILKKNSTFDGTGHGSVVRDKQGNDWHYYHAYHAGNHSLGRVQLLDRIHYNGSNWPYFGNGGTPSTTAQTNPVFTGDTAPTCSVAFPAPGTTVSGVTTLSAAAGDDSDVTEVVFYRWGPWASQVRIGNAKPTIFGWVVSWNTVGLSNGNHDVFAVATDTFGHRTYSTALTVNVQN